MSDDSKKDLVPAGKGGALVPTGKAGVVSAA